MGLECLGSRSAAAYPAASADSLRAAAIAAELWALGARSVSRLVRLLRERRDFPTDRPSFLPIRVIESNDHQPTRNRSSLYLVVSRAFRTRGGASRHNWPHRLDARRSGAIGAAFQWYPVRHEAQGAIRTIVGELPGLPQSQKRPGPGGDVLSPLLAADREAPSPESQPVGRSRCGRPLSRVLGVEPLRLRGQAAGPGHRPHAPAPPVARRRLPRYHHPRFGQSKRGETSPAVLDAMPLLAERRPAEQNLTLSFAP